MRTWLRDFDVTLFGAMVLLCLIGVVTVYCAAYQLDVGAARPYHLRQLLWFCIGLVVMIPAVAIDYRTLARLAWPVYALTVLLLLLVLVAGKFGGGAQRWLGVSFLRMQPSEIMKLALLICLASFLGRMRDRIQHLPILIAALIVALVPMVLILRQPDLGTTLALVPMVAVVLYVAGAQRRHLGILTGLGLGMLPLGWLTLQAYQKERLVSFMNPAGDPLGASYQLRQSLIAVGSGQWFGKGWLGGTQTQLNFLPVQHTDFIFSVFAEQWGFIGATILLLLYAALTIQSITIALNARDLLGSLLCMGVVTLLTFQVVVNLGMTVGLMPVTGLPLPFLSYGGSSLLTFMVGIGLILNVRLRQNLF